MDRDWLAAFPGVEIVSDQADASVTNTATGRTTTYQYDAVLRVAGGPAKSPHHPEFDALSLPLPDGSVDGAMVAVAGTILIIAAVTTAPVTGTAAAILLVFAAYGVIDYTLDTSGWLDANFGRKSELWE